MSIPRIGRYRTYCLIAVDVALTLFLSQARTVPAVATTADFMGPVSVSGPAVTNAISGNWSGYIVEHAHINNVNAYWNVPQVRCPKTGKTDSSVWVGIDGTGTSRTIVQAGTAQICVRGRADYYAWYEDYPKPTVVVDLLEGPTGQPTEIRPGDEIGVEVVAQALTLIGAPRQPNGPVCWGVFILDDTTGAAFDGPPPPTHGPCNTYSGQLHSAEWIVEAGGEPTLRLANYGLVNLRDAYAYYGWNQYNLVYSGTILPSVPSRIKETMAQHGRHVSTPSAILPDPLFDGQTSMFRIAYGAKTPSPPHCSAHSFICNTDT
jgi:hypothetical protein